MNWATSPWLRLPRTALPGDRRAGGESGHHRDHQLTVFRMAAGLYQCPAVQSRARPADRSGSHYRNGFGVVSLSQNLAEETQRVIHGGAPFHSASASTMGYVRHLRARVEHVRYGSRLPSVSSPVDSDHVPL